LFANQFILAVKAGCVNWIESSDRNFHDSSKLSFRAYIISGPDKIAKDFLPIFLAIPGFYPALSRVLFQVCGA